MRENKISVPLTLAQNWWIHVAVKDPGRTLSSLGCFPMTVPAKSNTHLRQRTDGGLFYSNVGQCFMSELCVTYAGHLGSVGGEGREGRICSMSMRACVSTGDLTGVLPLVKTRPVVSKPTKKLHLLDVDSSFFLPAPPE